ncbi:MAG TPA: NHL repeat-containing protein [Verrucomicrobiae bacterium]|jgi:DNA-binding beta-propeller fold protein YncE
MNPPQTVSSRFITLLLLGLTSASAQNIFVANFGNNTVSEFGADGNLVNATFASGLDSPSGMAFDRTGNFYVANHNGGLKQNVSEFNSAGGLIAATFVGGLNTPEGLAFDTNGNFYLSNSGDNTVLEFDASGKNLLRTISNPNLTQPIGLAFDRKGNLYVANRGDGVVAEFDADGNPVNGGIFASGLNDPEGVAFDSRGNLYVASFLDGTVSLFDPAGNLITATFASGLSHPIGLAFDTAGNLYAANFTGNTVSKFDAAGNLINAAFFSGLNSPSYIAIQGISLPISQPTAPTLAVKYMAGRVTVSWPFAAGYILQQNSDLTTANWLPASSSIATNGAVESVIITNEPANNLFFRLSQP